MDVIRCLIFSTFIFKICCTGEKLMISAYYNVKSRTGKGLEGLRCLSENVEFRRDVKFNSTSGVCEKLDEQWMINATYETGFAYMLLVSYEIPFSENVNAISRFPTNFDVGCHFDVIFKTPNIQLTWFKIKTTNSTAADSFIRLNFNPSNNNIVFRSKYMGNLTEQITVPNRVTKLNTVYRATVFVFETHWSVYLDGVHLKNFTYDHPFCCKHSVQFISDEVLCQRIIYYCP